MYTWLSDANMSGLSRVNINPMMQSSNISTWDQEYNMQIHTLPHISKHVLLGSFYWHYPWVKVRLELHYETALMTGVRAWNSHNLNIWGGFSLALLFLTWNGTLLTMAWRRSGQSSQQQVRITDYHLCSSLFDCLCKAWNWNDKLTLT